MKLVKGGGIEGGRKDFLTVETVTDASTTCERYDSVVVIDDGW